MCFVVVCIINVIQLYVNTIPTDAETIPLSQIPVGKVVSVNGMKFVKIDENKYLAAVAYGVMQGWNGCNSLPTPACVGAGTCTTSTVINDLYTLGPTLMDTRDGKRYEIRKYADGQCWMADDLKYGGTTASIVGTVFANTNNYCTQQTPISSPGDYANLNNSWYMVENGVSTGTKLRGMCYNPGPINETNSAAIGWASAIAETGYFYTWGAATQDDYTTGAIGARKVQGICPAGWHLPVEGNAQTAANTSGNNANCTTTSCATNTSDFSYLDKLYGGTGANNQTSVTHARQYFWGIPNNVVFLDVGWKGTYPGCSGSSACVSVQRGTIAQWWSAGAGSSSEAWFLHVHTDNVYPVYFHDRGDGFRVRCAAD
jgi:uncharacterized protein (TIGR02145 family)